MLPGSWTGRSTRSRSPESPWCSCRCPRVELVDPLPLCELVVPDELVPVLLGAEVPETEVALPGVTVPVDGSRRCR